MRNQIRNRRKMRLGRTRNRQKKHRIRSRQTMQGLIRKRRNAAPGFLIISQEKENISGSRLFSPELMMNI